METNPVVEQIQFSPLSELVQPVWFYHLTNIFLCVLLCRVARALGIVNWLHRLLIVVCSLMSTAGRQRRAERKRLGKELHAMRAELKTISMTHEFVRYSRLERRIKSSTQRFSQLAPESWSTSFFRAISINVCLYAIEGIIMGWLVHHSPSVMVTRATLADVDSYGFLISSFFRVLRFIPSKIAVILWIFLCHGVTNPVANWFSAYVSTSSQSTGPLDNGDMLASHIPDSLVDLSNE